MIVIIKSIKVSDFRAVSSQQISLNEHSTFPKGSQVIGIIGPNGSGKTTLCSMISKIFESFSRIRNCDFHYEIEFSQNGLMYRVRYAEKILEYFINGELIHKYDITKNLSPKKLKIFRSQVRDFWCGNLILSTFETSGEYPNQDNSKDHNKRIIHKYDVSNIYGKNLYSYPSLTNGILNYVIDSGKHKFAKSLFEKMNLFFDRELEVKITANTIGFVSGISELIKSGKISIDDDDAIHEDYDMEFIKYLISGTGYLLATSDPQKITVSNLMGLYTNYPSCIGKHIYVNSMIFRKNEIKVNFDMLSAGEKFTIIRYLSILSSIKDHSVVIVEEPENHLNPSWRELIIPLLHKICSSYSAVLIFTTHDFRAIRYLHADNVYTLISGKVNSIHKPTLLCDEYDFEGYGNKIEEMVYREIDQLMENSDSEMRERIVDGICRVPEKYELIKKYLMDGKR